MGVVVTFNYANWIARYPEFSTVSEQTATAYFNEATVYHRNDGFGPVSTAAIQTTLLNMLTAHIAARYATIGGVAASPLVGRIRDATEGSVSVGTDMPSQPGTAAWYQQTKYGADYWAATAQYRTFRPIPASPRNGRAIYWGQWPQPL